jgi:hypothetical protein
VTPRVGGLGRRGLVAAARATDGTSFVRVTACCELAVDPPGLLVLPANCCAACPTSTRRVEQRLRDTAPPFQRKRI